MRVIIIGMEVPNMGGGSDRVGVMMTKWDAELKGKNQDINAALKKTFF